MMQNLDRETITKIVETTVENILAAFNPVAKPETLAPLNPTLSQQEFADLTDLGVNRVNALVRAGRIRHVKLGSRNVRIPRAELTEFFERESIGGQK